MVTNSKIFLIDSQTISAIILLTRNKLANEGEIATDIQT